jgi:hypothetical protein
MHQKQPPENVATESVSLIMGLDAEVPWSDPLAGQPVIKSTVITARQNVEKRITIFASFCFFAQ